MRLGTWRPLAQAAEAVAVLTGVSVSAATGRRLTEGAGAAEVAVQTAAVERREREWPAAPPGPRVQLCSVDGAMVPLPHGEWVEVKTLAIGTGSAPVLEQGTWVVPTADRSSFSRLPKAEPLGRPALVETHRRGTATAETVWAVRDGAEWSQGCVALHRPEAVRLLAVPPALGDVAHAGHARDGEGPAAFTPWVAPQRHTWHSGHPAAVVGALRPLATAAKRNRAVTAPPILQESLHSLEKRRGRLDDAWDQARGDPLGSGRVESANTLVVERRRQGRGRHWARAPVNPLVARRTGACRDRWQEAWRQIAQHVREHYWQGRGHRQTDRRPSATPRPWPCLPPHPPVALPADPCPNRCLPRAALPRPNPLHRKLPRDRIARPRTTRGGASTLAGLNLNDLPPLASPNCDAHPYSFKYLP